LRIATFLLAALAAASAAYWVLKWSASAPAAAPRPATPSFSQAAQADPQGVARLLGGGQKAVVALVDNAASHFKLIGVVANRTQGGYALISIDGQPAKPYRVGSALNDALLLKSVATRSATLAASPDGPASFTLELPPPSGASVTAAPAPMASAGIPAATPAAAPGEGKVARSRAARSTGSSSE
jgi:general secretion pathway protein C